MDGSLKVALVHDWLTGMRGGEKVLEVFCELFPDAPLYTLLHARGSVSRVIEEREIVTSSLQRMPGAVRHYRRFLPVMPALVEQLRPSGVDLVLSSSSCVAKGVRAPRGAKHASYVHSPMRYVYDRFDDYFAPDRAGLAVRAAMNVVRRPLQKWDRATADRVDRYAANSTFVRERVFRCFGRDSDVIPPPVDVARFAVARRRDAKDYYLIVAALVPYKMVDVAVEAFRHLGRPLVIAGAGPMLEKLRAAAPPNVTLMGWVDDEQVVELVAACRAFLMPNVEDFGIAPVEAMAAGRPVIALGEGGVVDTVRDLDRVDQGVFGSAAPTGLFYSEPNPAGLAAAVRRFERNEHRFISAETSAWTKQFDRPTFERRIRGWLADVLGRKAALPRAA